ncbi:MAG: HAMP domain-containing sensor histidine kinase [Bacteroidota bacterium]
MKNFWHFVSHLGISGSVPRYDIEYILVANRVCFVLVFLNAIFTTTVYFSFGVVVSVPYLFGFNLFLVAILVMHHYGWHTLGRILLSASIPIYALVLSIIIKLNQPLNENFTYYESRIFIFVSVILPSVFFSFKNKKTVLLLTSLSLLLLAFFDPVHNLFNVGYYDVGLEDTRYYYINVIFIFGAVVMIVPIIFLKRVNLQFAIKNGQLIGQLNESNDELEAQNEQLQQLNKEIINNTLQLKEANQIIEEQAEELRVKNEQLYGIVEKTSQDLVNTNKTLKARNAELEHFSFAVSHNVRGPIASILGLLNLFEMGGKKIDEDLVNRIRQSAVYLDDVIKGLGGILSINTTTVDSSLEWVNLNEELRAVEVALSEQLKMSKASIEKDFTDVEDIFTIEPFLKSVFYNLVSNSIKYRDHTRALLIKVTTSRLDYDKIRITVTDNGIGVDLEQFGEQIFQMSKRFHTHTHGHGLGLYIVKKQVESMNGRISVESTVNEGTSFHVDLPEQLGSINK